MYILVLIIKTLVYEDTQLTIYTFNNRYRLFGAQTKS